MNKSTLTIIIYVIGLIFGAVVLGFWDDETSLDKASIALIWTALFLIALFDGDKITQNNLKNKLLIISIFFFNFYSHLYSEIVILSGCNNIKDDFIKNEYILDLKKSLMNRN